MSDSDTIVTGFAALIEDLRKAIGTEVLSIDGRSVAALPEGVRVEDLEEYSSTPSRIRAHRVFYDVPSLVSYVNDFKEAGTRIFIDPSECELTAILDGPTPEGASWASHWAQYSFPLSRQWQRWAAFCGRQQTQSDTVRFLEENLEDIVEPDAATVLEMCRSLEVNKKVEFASAQRSQSGAVTLVYKETMTEGQGQMKLPDSVVVGFPVFEGGVAYKIKAWLRYRIVDAKLFFAVELHRAEFVKDDAFRFVAKEIADGTGVPVHFGRP